MLLGLRLGSFRKASYPIAAHTGVNARTAQHQHQQHINSSFDGSICKSVSFRQDPIATKCAMVFDIPEDIDAPTFSHLTPEEDRWLIELAVVLIGARDRLAALRDRTNPQGENARIHLEAAVRVVTVLNSVLQARVRAQRVQSTSTPAGSSKRRRLE